MIPRPLDHFGLAPSHSYMSAGTRICSIIFNSRGVGGPETAPRAGSADVTRDKPSPSTTGACCGKSRRTTNRTTSRATAGRTTRTTRGATEDSGRDTAQDSGQYTRSDASEYTANDTTAATSRGTTKGASRDTTERSAKPRSHVPTRPKSPRRSDRKTAHGLQLTADSRHRKQTAGGVSLPTPPAILFRFRSSSGSRGSRSGRGSRG